MQSRRGLSEQERSSTILHVVTDKHRLLNLVDENGVDRNLVLQKAPFSAPAVRIKSPGICTEMLLAEDEQHLMLWYDSLERFDVRSSTDGQLVKSFDGFADFLCFPNDLFVGLKDGTVKVGALPEPEPLFRFSWSAGRTGPGRSGARKPR